MLDRTQGRKKYQCAIALGSNLGDSGTILHNALLMLDQTPGIAVIQASSWYRTVPIGPPQPDYLNGCAVLEVAQTPEELLVLLQSIELQFGRVRGERWGARTLDLDLIFYGDLVLDLPNLQVPHPRMRERAFVLIPLAEIAPDWIEPVSQKSIDQLVRGVDPRGVALVES
jgi:2-amino-4-hydroxy-6-hydroxymethyldihydropteridine diphosphokinase